MKIAIAAALIIFAASMRKIVMAMFWLTAMPVVVAGVVANWAIKICNRS